MLNISTPALVAAFVIMMLAAMYIVATQEGYIWLLAVLLLAPLGILKAALWTWVSKEVRKAVSEIRTHAHEAQRRRKAMADKIEQQARDQVRTTIVEKALRTFGWFFSPAAFGLWLFTVAVSYFAYLAPVARSMPFMFGLTFFQLYMISWPVGFMILMIVNAFAGRWGPITLRGFDIWTTRLFVALMVLLCVLVFAFDKGPQDYSARFGDLRTIKVPEDLRPIISNLSLVLWAVAAGELLVTTVFAFYDLMVHLGDQWRSSALLVQLHGLTVAQWKKMADGLQPAATAPTSTAPSWSADESIDPTAEIIAKRGPGFLKRFYDLGVKSFPLLSAKKVIVYIHPSGWPDWDVEVLPDEVIASARSYMVSQGMIASEPAAPAE